jgi:hypothetical protein
VVYHHESGRVLRVDDEKQHKAALKHGFKNEPSPSHDYSKMRGDFAARKEVREVKPEEMSAKELLALEESGK